MSNLFYYDADNIKHSIDLMQLAKLAHSGVINPETVLENAKGMRITASAVKGLTFADQSEQPPKAEAPTSAPSPNASLAERSILTSTTAPAASASSNVAPVPTRVSPTPPSPQATLAPPVSTQSVPPPANYQPYSNYPPVQLGATPPNAFYPPQGGVMSQNVAAFCSACGAPLALNQAFCTRCGARVFANAGFVPQAPAQYQYARPGVGKSKVAAALFAFFLGGLGLHKFYLGSWGWGLVYLLTCWTLIPAFLAFIEFIVYLVMSDEEFDRRYSREPAAAFKW